MNATRDDPAHDSDASCAQHPLGELAARTGDYLRAWGELFTAEMQLARLSVNRLLLGALCACVLLLCSIIAGDALAAVLLYQWLQDWASAAALTLLLDLLALAVVLLAMGQWWRNLSLPRSRGALRQLLQRLDATDHASPTD